MPTRRFQTLSALSGIAGVIMLVISFSINNGPPAGATGTQIVAYGQHHLAATFWGAWLQAIGALLIVLFVFAVVRLANATSRLAGWMTLFGAVTLMTVSLVEIVYYMSELNATPVGTDRTALGVVSIQLINSVQHLYFIVAAPALFIPLGVVLLGSRVLPRPLGHLAILLGAAYAIAGMVFLTDRRLPALIQSAASIQVLWFLAATITLIVRPHSISEPVPVPQGTLRNSQWV